MNKLPLLYYPTTLYWVDDDKLFLEVAADRFQNDYTVVTSTSPKKAIEYLSHHKPLIDPLSFLKSCTEHEEYDLSEHLPVDVNFEAVKRIQNNERKIDDIAVMIVDFNMPEMNGIELCSKLKAIPTKKILLTGNADFQQAVDAFNEGIINCFICKDDADIDQKLSENVDKLSKEYFIEPTSALLNHIESDKSLPHSDPIFIDFFTKICEKMNIKEYYIIDKNGSMLLIDSKNQIQYLIVQTDQALDNFVELHQNVPDSVEFTNEIKNRNKIPFFGVSKEAWNVDTSEWAKHFYHANLLKGKQNYHWAIVPA